MTSLNIYEKLFSVRKSVEFLQKSAFGFQYKYVTESQILFAVRKAIDEQRLFLQVGMSHETDCFSVNFTWINVDNVEEKIHERIFFNGLNDNKTVTTGTNKKTGEDYVKEIRESDQRLTGSILTYAMRYFLLKNFMIATDEADLDTYQAKNQGQKIVADAKLSKEQEIVADAKLSKKQVDSILSLCEGRHDIIAKIVKHAPQGKLENLAETKFQGIVNFVMAELEVK